MTRLEQFRVQRYGHFEDLTIELGPGCTVVYGENEAGKSTLLDALSDFLWGFTPRHHPREFVYKRSQMLLEGTVAEGENRLYARQATKFSCNGEAVEAPPWAVDLNRTHWDHAYGLNLERLQRGGRDVVHGRDDPGGISFLADTGLPIDDVMKRLGASQKELFGTHANNKNSTIRQLLARLGDIDKRMEDAGASAQDVERLEVRLAELEASLGHNSGRAANVDHEIKLVQELLRALDHVQRLATLDEDIAEVAASGQVLGRTETEELRTALRDVTEIDAHVTTLTNGIAKATEQLHTHEPRIDVLERTGDIHAAVRELEARRQDAAVLLDTSAANHRQEVVNLLDSLGQNTEDLQAARRAVLVSADRQEQLDRKAGILEAATTALATARAKVLDATARVEQESAPAAGSETLVAQLTRRDEAWRAVREPWISGVLPGDTVRVELATRLDAAIEAADDEAERAATALEQLGVSRGKRQQAEAELTREQKQLATVEAAEAAAKKDWDTLVKDSGLPAGTDTQAWHLRAEILGRLTEAWRKLQEQETRHQDAQERFDDFQARVSRLAVLLAAPTGDALTDIDALDQLLKVAESTDNTIRGIQSTIDEATRELAALESTRAQAESRVTDLAKGEDPVDLLERSTSYHQLLERRSNTTELIAAATPSIPSLTEIQAALADHDREALQAKEAQLASQRLVLATAITEDERAVGATQSELSALQHKEGTAALLAERQEVAAQIVEFAEQYRNLRVQELILHEYAKLNADRSDTPILDRAGEYLNVLTGGRHQGFSILTVGADKHLRIQSLVGDTVQDTEPAKLSDGTEHQVYFALRLAGITARQEERVRKAQPTVPVVLDDVFQAFDDERSATALQLLAELGQQFQIIVMTHERAIYNIAEDMPQVHTVRLTAPLSPAGT